MQKPILFVSLLVVIFFFSLNKDVLTFRRSRSFLRSRRRRRLRLRSCAAIFQCLLHFLRLHVYA